MAGYQQMTIVGNVGRDAALKYTKDGVAVADFSVAVNRTFGTGDQKTEILRWYKVTCWRKLAEIAGEYVKKGQQIMVVANDVTSSAYLGKDGKPASSIELTADTFQILGKRDGESSTNRTAPPEGKPQPVVGEKAPIDYSEIPF